MKIDKMTGSEQKHTPKLLALCSAIDLNLKGGCTPFYWGLFAALSRIGIDITVMPFLGRAVQSLWWNTQENPVRAGSLIDLIEKPHELLTKASSHSALRTEISGTSSPLRNIRQLVIRSQERKWVHLWLKAIESSLSAKKFDAIGMFCPPAHIIVPYVDYLRNKYDIPIFLYEADFPTYLFNDSNFRASWYSNVDIGAFDAVLVNSEGVLPKLRNMGIRKAFSFDFGADASSLSYPPQRKDIDMSFYGYGSYLREEAMKEMITVPSRKLPKRNFVVAGQFEMDLGDATRLSSFDNMKMKRLCYRSKINLNITRRTFAETISSSTARLFELAAMGACIVSNPCKGIEKWFEPGKEIIIVHGADEALETYETLLSSNGICDQMGKNARERALRDHSYDKRALEFRNILSTFVP